MSGVLSSIKRFFGIGEKPAGEYKTAEVYNGLREQVFSLDPESIGLSRAGGNSVWGMLMETGYAEAVATLVTIGDGTVSLYFSNGGGIIGVGQHEGPRRACEAFLADAPSFLRYASPTDCYPLPERSYTRFYFLTFDGVLTAEAMEKDLGYNRHPLSPLFHKAHEVITEAMRVNEGK
jgi:hypothetical protein